MTDFTFITANDIHISDTGPRSRIDDFKASILNKITQMRTACRKLGADAALIAGDLYNLKTPSRNSHALNQELIREFTQFPCPRYAIEGNHDLTGNHLDSLDEQPLGVLFADKTLIQLRHEIIEKDGHKISLVGIPFSEDFDPQRLEIPDKGDCIAQICLLHAYTSPTAGMLFNTRIFGYKEFLHLSPDIFVIGHYHIDQGVKELEGKHFINIGSLSRGTLTEEEINHKPQIGLIKVSVDDEGQVSINAQSIKLKVKPPEEIFDLERREEEKKETEEIELFVEKLASESMEGIGSEEKDYNEVVGEMKEVTQTVKDKVVYFLQEAAARR